MYTFSLPNQQSSIEIQIINDTILEEDEQFLVGFSFLSFVPVLSFQEQALVTILDDDSEFMLQSLENEPLALITSSQFLSFTSFIRVHAVSALGVLLSSHLCFFPSTLLSNNSWL